MDMINRRLLLIAVLIGLFSALDLAAQEQPSSSASSSEVSEQELSEDEKRAAAIKQLEQQKQAALEKKAEREKQAEQKKKQEQENKDSGKPSQPKKVFKPTEEISEDLPVPFPVDI